MAEKTISPGMKLALDLGPVVAFFAGYFLLRDRSFEFGGHTYSGFVIITALFVPLLALTTFLSWRLTGHVSKMNLVTLAIVVVFGGLTVWFDDERFFKMKPTILYALFAAVLGFGLMRRRSYLEPLMGEALPLTHEGWMILTRRLALFFAVLAVLNELVWRNFSTETWVTFKTFGLTAAVFAFFLTQGRVFERHSASKDEET